MVKKYDSLVKNTSTGQRRATILIGVMILFSLFSINFVSSAEFDNVGSYKNNYKTIEIENSFGFGDKIAEITLDTPIINYVMRGRNRLVAEFTITNLEDYAEVFNQMDFYNINKGMQKFDREFTYKFKEEYEVDINDYETTCKTRKNINGSNEDYDCVKNLVGSHKENRHRWNYFNENSELKKGNITIGIFTNVYADEKIEWIPTLFGVEIDQWAAWTEGLNTGLKHYYNFEENTGTFVNDSIGGDTYNGTTLSGNWDVGIIGTAYNSTGGGIINITGNITDLPDNSYSINFWVLEFDNAIDRAYFHTVVKGGNALQNRLIASGTNSIKWTTDGTDTLEAGKRQQNVWTMITATVNSTGKSLYVNGTEVGSNAGTSTEKFENAYFGYFWDDPSQNLNGRIDEIGMWNRSLSPEEVSQLYNDGAGLSPNDTSDITLNFPADNFENLSNIVIFNCSAEDVTQIDNITLIIDGVVNTTVTGSSPTLSLQKELKMPFKSSTWNCNATNSANDVLTGTQRSLSLGFITINETYNSDTLIGNTESFTINISYNNSEFTSTQSILFYNGTTYEGTTSDTGSNLLFSRSVTVPSVPVGSDIEFNWQIGLFSGSWIYFNSTTKNQAVNTIQIGNCSNFTNVIYNYTLYDERTQVKVENTSVEVQINIFDLSRTISIVNFSQEYNHINPVQVCLNNSLLESANYSVDSVIKYTANQTSNNVSYVNEQYNILGQLLTNSTVPRNINLYPLKESESTEFQLSFRDESFAFAPNVLVYLYRQYVADNDFKVVEVPLTDSNGKTVLHMVRNDVVYNIIMKDSEGNIIGTFNKIIAFCEDFTIGQCSIRLTAEGLGGADIYDFVSDLGIYYSLPTYSSGTGLVSFDFVSIDLTSKTVRMDIVRNNAFGNRSVCTNSITSSSGTLTCDVSAVSATDRFLFISIYVNDIYLIQSTIDLEADDFNFGIVNGAFYAFLMLLFIITMFMEDKQALVVSLIVGWAVVGALALINGRIIGSLSSGIWLIICGIIFLWKLNKEETG